mgnify:CR=1 FL=1
MKYSKETIDKARDEISYRRQKAELVYSQHLERIREEFPEIYDEENKVRNVSLSLTGVILGHVGSDPEEAVRAIEKAHIESRENVKRMLKEKGLPEDYLETPYTCKRCKDTGSVEGINCECFKSLLKSFAAQEPGAGSTLKLHTFDEIRFDVYRTDAVRTHMKKMADFLKRYCNDFGKSGYRRSMLMYGSTGTGKTFISSCVASELSAQGFAVSFGSAFEYFKRIEDEHFGRAGGDTMGTMIDCDMLIIDDLGSEFKTSFTESRLYNIINTRMNAERPTIVSTNLSTDELKARYNDRISSRLLGTYAPIPFTGEDIRLWLMKNG